MGVSSGRYVDDFEIALRLVWGGQKNVREASGASEHC